MDSGVNRDLRYMRRALQLAAHGRLDASPNPMVGCVITDPEGRKVLGEGWHRRCGEGHAEVNAVADAKRRVGSIEGATVYVTLEPCSHYGKTPPCAKLLIDNKVGRVVIGSGDPNEKVNGRGAQMLRQAGITVDYIGDKSPQMQQACLDLNCKFMTAMTHMRPYVTLKWAQSADGYLDIKRLATEPAYIFSTPMSRAEVHRLRATHDAILVGAGTDRKDNPSLTTRHWAGKSPRRLVMPSGRVDLGEYLAILRAEGITSLLVEGGPTLLHSFLDAGLYDEIRVEHAPTHLGPLGSAKI